MYRRPKFLEILHEIRQEMSRAADYDVDLFVEQLRSGGPKKKPGSKQMSFPDIEAGSVGFEIHETRQQ